MRRKHKVTLGIALCVAIIGSVTLGYFILFPPPTEPQIPEVAIRLVCQLTGRNGLNNTTNVDINGTDLGIVFKYKDTHYYVFGDTVGDEFGWRSNAMAYSTDTTFSDGITFDGWKLRTLLDGSRYAKEVVKWSMRKSNKKL